MRIAFFMGCRILVMRLCCIGTSLMTFAMTFAAQQVFIIIFFVY